MTASKDVAEEFDRHVLGFPRFECVDQGTEIVVVKFRDPVRHHTSPRSAPAVRLASNISIVPRRVRVIVIVVGSWLVDQTVERPTLDPVPVFEAAPPLEPPRTPPQPPHPYPSQRFLAPTNPTVGALTPPGCVTIHTFDAPDSPFPTGSYNRNTIG